MAAAALDDTPNADSVIIMRDTDALPPAWRALVNEFGYNPTFDVWDAMRPAQRRPEEAFRILTAQRRRHQAEWLATILVRRPSQRAAARAHR